MIQYWAPEKHLHYCQIMKKTDYLVQLFAFNFLKNKAAFSTSSRYAIRDLSIDETIVPC